MKKNSKKWIIIGVVIVVILLLLFLIYKSVFASGRDSRNKDMSSHKLKNNEINAVESKIKEVEEVKSIDIHTNNNSRIIKIVVILSSDVDFKKMQEIANASLSSFEEDKLAYYDFEFYIDTENEESEVYPKIGYKFKTNSEFSW